MGMDIWVKTGEYTNQRQISNIYPVDEPDDDNRNVKNGTIVFYNQPFEIHCTYSNGFKVLQAIKDLLEMEDEYYSDYSEDEYSFEINIKGVNKLYDIYNQDRSHFNKGILAKYNFIDLVLWAKRNQAPIYGA